jgi:mannose-6-phosphate isomerase-like protein (cupin superfamily)
MNDRRDYLLGPDETLFDLPVTPLRYLVRGEDCMNQYSLIECNVADHIPPHVHLEEDESVYIIEGEVTVHIDDVDYDLVPGSFCFMPRGVPHAITVRKGPWRGLSVSAPGGQNIDKVAAYRAKMAAGKQELSPEELNRMRKEFGWLLLPGKRAVPGRGIIDNG